MTPFFSIFTADVQSIGRCDEHSLTDQARMELLMIGAQDVKRLQDDQGDFLDACEWSGVRCDSDFHVVSIDFDNTDYLRRCMAQLLTFVDDADRELGLDPYGSIDLRWIPATVVDFRVSGLAFEGSVNTALLPRELRQFTVTNNKLGGEFRIDDLPGDLEIARISNNSFSGGLNLPALPRFIVSFDAGSNKFSGKLNFAKLPAFLKVLDLRKNDFAGTVRIPFVPPKMRMLDISHNFFEGECVTIAEIPEAMDRFAVDDGFQGHVVDLDGKVWVKACIVFESIIVEEVD